MYFSSLSLFSKLFCLFMTNSKGAVGVFPFIKIFLILLELWYGISSWVNDRWLKTVVTGLLHFMNKPTVYRGILPVP